MSKQKLTKALLIALLLGTGAMRLQVSPHLPFAGWPVSGWVVFGIVNVFIPNRGAKWVRIISIAVSFLALLMPEMFKGLAVLAWLLWIPMIVAAVAERKRNRPPTGEYEAEPEANSARNALTAVILGTAVASMAFRSLVLGNLMQSAALFVGLPTLLAIIVVRAVSPRSAVGVACKAVTVGLLVSLLFLGEGILCIVVAAPLFYGVAIMIGLIVDYLSQDSEKTGRSSLLLLLFVPMSLEGVTNLTTLNRDEVVSVSQIVEDSNAAVSLAIQKSPRFERTRPAYLRAGFPIPVSSRLDQSGGSNRWIIGFRGGETRLNGMEPSPGDLTLQLEESRPGLVRWRAVSDTSHMTHFLNWRESTVQWESIGAQRTRVTWTLRYRRGLDPSWYFGPMERYAVRLAAGYLIDSVATP